MNLLLYKLCIIYTANYKYWAKHLISGLFLYPKIKLNTKIFTYDPIKTIIANPYLLHCHVYWLAYFGLSLLDRKQTRYCLYWFHHRVFQCSWANLHFSNHFAGKTNRAICNACWCSLRFGSSIISTFITNMLPFLLHLRALSRLISIWCRFLFIN